MMGTISPGFFTDNGVQIQVKGGPWTIGSPPRARIGCVFMVSPSATYSWSGTQWTKLS